MNKLIDLHVLFDGYSKDISTLYNLFPNINTSEMGDVIFNAINIVFEDYLEEVSTKVSIADFQLEICTNKSFNETEKELAFINATVISKEENSYILTKDPAGLKVKIYFSDKEITPRLLIPYKGLKEDIDTFYNALDVKSINGTISIENFKIEYYSKNEDIQRFAIDTEIWLLTEDEPEIIKNKVESNGGIVIADSGDSSIYGRMIFVQDPAGISLCILPPNKPSNIE